jgi:uncharacterized protein (DUF983 family)
MKCPKCNETPIPFLRYISTSKGVHWKKALRGYLVCERCGLALRVRTYHKLFWVFVILLVVLLFVETYFLQKFIPDLSQSLVVLIFLASVLAIGMTSGYIEWKFTELEETPREELQ